MRKVSDDTGHAAHNNKPQAMAMYKLVNLFKQIDFCKNKACCACQQLPDF